MFQRTQPSIFAAHIFHAYLIRTHLENKSKLPFSNFGVMKHKRACDDLESICYYLPHISFTIEWTDTVAKQNSDYNLIDYRMSDDELTAFDKWVKDKSVDPTAQLIELAGMSYKISLTYVENSEAWCISLTGREDAKFNSKTTLTTWADDPVEGIYMAAFKATQIFKGGKWQTKTQSKRG